MGTDMGESHIYLLMRDVCCLNFGGLQRTEILGAYRSRIEAECEMEREQHRQDLRETLRKEGNYANYNIERVMMHG